MGASVQGSADGGGRGGVLGAAVEQRGARREACGGLGCVDEGALRPLDWGERVPSGSGLDSLGPGWHPQERRGQSRERGRPHCVCFSGHMPSAYVQACMLLCLWSPHT